MSKNVILDQVFPIRSKAVIALGAEVVSDTAEFKRIVEDAQRVAVLYGHAPVSEIWRFFAEVLDVVSLLVEWQDAVMSAAIDADRFLRAARLRLELIGGTAKSGYFVSRVLQEMSCLDGNLDFAVVRNMRQRIACVPMPVAIYNDPGFVRPDWAVQSEGKSPERLPELAVAFVEFKINGAPAERLQSLSPKEAHDLDIVLRVSRWPIDATSLILTPVSIEPRSAYDLPTFGFERPSGDPPYFFQQRGRMVLHVPQALKARPFEFVYAAEFQPTEGEQPKVAGQRTLRLNGYDPRHQQITGYPGVDRRLIDIRDKLRVEPLIPQEDLEELLAVLVPIGNIMGQSLQDARFPDVISEVEFQKRIREVLRREPNVGVALEEQAHAGGGRTDLSYKGIRIELKVESSKRLLPEDCKRYASQPASYAVGTNRRVALLCVLDCSPKSEVPFPAEDGLYVYPVDTGASPVYIVVCLIQGNLAKPSSFSR